MKTKLEKCKVIASDMNIANYLNFKHDDNFIRKIEKIIGQECIDAQYQEIIKRQKKELKALNKKREIGSNLYHLLCDGQPLQVKKILKYGKYIFNYVSCLGLREPQGGGDVSISFRQSTALSIEVEESNNWNVYSGRCRYPAVNRQYIIYLPKSGWIMKVGGMLTWCASLNKKGCKASWIVQGRGVQADIERGFLVNGYHVSEINAKSIKDARKYLCSIRIKERIREHKYMNTIVNYQDSLDAGNCESGTRHFINKHDLDANKSYSISYLLRIADALEVKDVKRMIK